MRVELLKNGAGAFTLRIFPPAQWLEFYARYFPAVEVDSTFYSVPAENTARRWMEMTGRRISLHLQIAARDHTCSAVA